MEESLLFGELDGLLGEISTDSEAMLDMRVQIDLVGDVDLDEDFLGLVALLGREDLIMVYIRVSRKPSGA